MEIIKKYEASISVKNLIDILKEMSQDYTVQIEYSDIVRIVENDEDRTVMLSIYKEKD